MNITFKQYKELQEDIQSLNKYINRVENEFWEVYGKLKSEIELKNQIIRKQDSEIRFLRHLVFKKLGGINERD